MIVLALAAVAMGVLWQRALRDDSDMAALLAADVRDESGYVALSNIVRRAYLRINGKWEDHVHMVLLNDAWTEHEPGRLEQ